MRVGIFHASAGHGHAKVAEAVREGLIASGLSAQEISLLDVLDETPAWFRMFYTSLYYYSVKHTPKTWGIFYHLTDHDLFYRRVIRHLRRFVNALMTKNLVKRIMEEKFDAIISTHFLAPEVLGHLKTNQQISSFLVTVVTDFIPHAFWVNSGTDHYWVMSEEGKANLIQRRIPEEKITAGGIPVSLKFKPHGDKKETRHREDLHEERFTLLVTSGSFGLGPTSEVLESLREFGDLIQIMVVCGRNESQFHALQQKGYPFLMRPYKFVSHMDQLMEASDLMIAKPGGATTAESLVKRLPMVVLDPIPGQEMGNARLLKERNVAFFLNKPSDIKIILKGIFDYPEMLEEKKRAIDRLAKAEAAIQLARFVLSKIKK